MFKLETLDVLKDDELQAISQYCTTLLKAREEQRKKDAIEKARSALAGVGLTFKDVFSRVRGSAGKTTYKAGTLYYHPDDKALTWNAKGQKPNWVRTLEAAGKRAMEAPSAG
jgi:hypothetical protein